MSFLGIQLDSVAMTLSCTPERVAELTSLLQSLRQQHRITRKHLESLIGKLSFAALVLPGARPFLRRMLDTLQACTSKRRSATVRIDPGFRADVRFWLEHLSDWNGKEVWRSSRSSPFSFASDASLDGFGFHLESVPQPCSIETAAWPHSYQLGATFSGSYSPKHADFHRSHTQITWCELLAVVAAASTYAPLLRNQSLVFFVDNSTDVHIINRQATKSRALAGLLRLLYAIALRYNLTVKAVHRPGVDNTLADFLSRPLLHRNEHVVNWQLTHRAEAHRLSSVSLVSSDLYVSSSSSSQASPSVSTRRGPTARTTEPSSRSVPPSTSTLTSRSPRKTYAQLLSSTAAMDTKSLHSPASFPLSPTTSYPSATLYYPEIGCMRASVPDSRTGSETPTCPIPNRQSPSTTFATSAVNSISHLSPTRETGAPVFLPSMDFCESENMQAAVSA